MLLIAFVSSGLYFYTRYSTKSTECYTIFIPNHYTTLKTTDTCQLVSYIGPQSSASHQILLLPINSPITLEEARAKLQKHNGVVEQTTINGYDAVGQRNTNNNGNIMIAYIIIPNKTYSPSGSKGPIYGFYLNFLMPAKDKNVPDEIISKIHWK
ncbi:MAG: hypothetical protein NVSMB46_01920 [Candidatus Saccharimonadales bacterium]